MYKISKEIQKRINNETYYNVDEFIKDCKTYIAAVESGRINYEVTHVSQSGMSRDILITSYEGTMKKGYYRTYYSMLKALGYKFAGNSSDIKVRGCGMDMCFATNYGIIKTFKRIGLIRSKRAGVLCQKV